MDQRQWIIRALEGDHTAKAHLFEENIEPIYYLCWKLTGSAAQAGELTRRTFARAFSQLIQLRPDASFERWITAIAVNLCRQSLKKSQNWLFTTDEREMALLRDTYVAGEECLPESCLNEPEKRSLALRTISLLPPEQRICMILRYVAQLKPHQIAKIMEVDELTVLGRLNSGRRALLTTLPDPAPKALLTDLFRQEAAALPVPELLRQSCMQTVLNARPEPTESEERKDEAGKEEEKSKKGFFSNLFANMSKKQKYLLLGCSGLAVILIVLILVLILRGCSPQEEPAKLPEPEEAPIEEIDEDLESAALLEEYGIEVLLTCNRREAQELVDAWQSVLPEYIANGTVDDLDLKMETSNDEVSEVRLRLEQTDLDITRLRDLGLGVEPELHLAMNAIEDSYRLACYEGVPLFDPTPRADQSAAAYSENYRYELLDDNGDGRAEALSITRTGANFDAEAGVFRPYGESLSETLGLRKEDAQLLFGEGGYEGEGVDFYSMAKTGVTSDDAPVTVTAVMEARTEMDAARQRVTALTFMVDGCFAELLPELQLPDSALSLNQLNRKLQGMKGHIGLLPGDVFAPLSLRSGDDFLVYYTGATRYLFSADDMDSLVSNIEVLDISDCRLWDSGSLSFRQDGFDLEKLLGLDRYAAYSEYGIRSYSGENFASSALGLWESDGIIRTVHNAADLRPLWGISLGDSRDSIEAKVESAGGYCCQADDASARYVLPNKRELAVTFDGSGAKTLQLEDHSHKSDYKAPDPLQKPAEELFAEFLTGLSDVKASWYGDLTHDQAGELLVCRPSGSDCLVQLYVIKDGEVNKTPIYSQTLAASSATDIYIVSDASGPALLYYTLSENGIESKCSWKLFSINAAGGEVILGQNEAKLNLLEMVLGQEEDYNAVKQEAAAYCTEGKYLCGTQTGSVDYSDMTANFGE